MYINFSKLAKTLKVFGTTMVPPCCVLDRIIDRRFAEKVKVFQCS